MLISTNLIAEWGPIVMIFLTGSGITSVIVSGISGANYLAKASSLRMGVDRLIVLTLRFFLLMSCVGVISIVWVYLLLQLRISFLGLIFLVLGMVLFALFCGSKGLLKVLPLKSG